MRPGREMAMIRSFVYGVLKYQRLPRGRTRTPFLDRDDTAEVEKVMAENGLTLKAPSSLHTFISIT